MTYCIHPDTEQDIADGLDFDKHQASLVVASRFLSEFERVAELLVDHPEFGTLTAKGRRVFPLRIFPHSVVYRVVDMSIRMIVVRHQYRKPAAGDSRQ